MKPRHQVSRAALELIERFEGYRRTAARLPDGRWTIGYGHTKTAREGAEVSPQDAEALLIYDLIEVAAAVGEWVFAPLTQNQFDALCAFALNIGVDNFRHSQVLKKLNEGAFLQAACAMDMWRKTEFEGEKIVVDALVRRRAAEKALFLSAPGVYAPTPILPPQIDYEASNLVPRREPVEVRTDLNGETATAERVSPTVISSEAQATTPEIPPVAPAADPSAPPWPVFRPDASAPTPPAAEPLWSAPQDPVPEATELRWAPPEPEPEAPTPPAEDRAGLDLPAPPEGPPMQDGVLTLTPPPQIASVEPPRPFAEDEEPQPSAANESEPELFTPEQPAVAERADLGRRVVRPGVVIDDLEPFPDSDETIIKSGMPPMLVWFLGLGVVGLAVFAGGIFFGVNAKQGAGWQVGMGLGVVGIICVAAAVYFLLERLGGREE